MTYKQMPDTPKPGQNPAQAPDQAKEAPAQPGRQETVRPAPKEENEKDIKADGN